MPNTPFKLSDKFVSQFGDKRPPFGFGVAGELTYFRTYSRIKHEPDCKQEKDCGCPNEQWFETCRRVVEGTYRMQQAHIEAHKLGWNPHHAQRSAQEMYERIFSMKFLPPGRGLWAMGSAITEERGLFAALNNCLASETKILTRDGFKAIGELSDTTQLLLTTNGKWVEAPIQSFGEQELRKIVLQRQGIQKIIFATGTHEWFAKSASDIGHSKGFQKYTTDMLSAGYRLQYVFGQQPSNFSPQGIQHGICFGDGTADHLYLIGQKNFELAKWFSSNRVAEAPEKNALRVADLPAHFKKLPDIRFDRKYLLGWLMGYFAADGTVGKTGQVTLSSSSKENLQFVQDAAAICGFGTYSVRLDSTSSNLMEERALWELAFMPDTLTSDFFLIDEHKRRFNADRSKCYWNVVSVEKTDRVEEVFCAVVPDTEAFTIEGNILTHNCAFVSTANLKEDMAKPFVFLMDMAMLGVGVGFDTRGAGQLTVKGPNPKRGIETYVIPDSREGWVESVKLLLESYFLGTATLQFDYSLIRSAGSPIKGFGGISAGPAPLMELHQALRQDLNEEIAQPISITTIVDIMNLVGKAVVAGGIRRTSEIAFGDFKSTEFIDLKNYKVNPHRETYGWTSNNSIFANIGMEYEALGKRIQDNGEPGVAWLENMRGYSRMNNGPDFKDKRADGGNPCLVGSTLIAVADGRNAVRIDELVGSEYPVYSVEQGKVVIKPAKRTWKTREKTEVIRVVLDDGSSFTCTPDHLVMQRNGAYVEASNLKNGDSVMPFNSLSSEKGYRNILGSGKRASRLRVMKAAGVWNHKVDHIEFAGYEDVYDIYVEDTHNFGIITSGDDKFVKSSGVFVHNCLEQTLESYELCCLVETFPQNHKDTEDFLRTLKFAYLYAKTVTLGETHWPETNRVMLRNRRIGCSVSGVQQFVAKRGLEELRKWLVAGYDMIQKYDETYSDWLVIPRSRKTTSVKPSGTVSLLVGATPGHHFPESRYYIRRIRISNLSLLVPKLERAGYKVEPCFGLEGSTVVVEVPVDMGPGIRSVHEVSMWEQLAMAAFMQKYWADNQVSATIRFDPVTEGPQIQFALDYYQYQLKGVSFLPNNNNIYPQMPYEAITEQQYNELSQGLKKVMFGIVKGEAADSEKFCSNDTCELTPGAK